MARQIAVQLGGSAAPPPPNPSTWSANGIPAVGSGKILIGGTGYLGGKASAADVEADLGTALAVHRIYYSPTDWDAGLETLVAEDHAKDCIPWISWKVPDNDWAAVASGAQDAWALALAARVNAITTGPVWICFHHEPEGDGTPADFIAMQRRLLPMFTGAHVAKSVIATSWQEANNDATWSWASLYPGDGYIDIYGIDPYNFYGSNLGSTWREFIDDPSQGDVLPLLKAYLDGRPTGSTSGGPIRIAIAETGWTDTAFSPGPNLNDLVPQGSTREWLARIRQNVLAYDGIAVAYFGVYYAPPTNQWNFKDKTAKTAAVANVQAITDRYPFA